MDGSSRDAGEHARAHRLGRHRGDRLVAFTLERRRPQRPGRRGQERAQAALDRRPHGGRHRRTGHEPLDHLRGHAEIERADHGGDRIDVVTLAAPARSRCASPGRAGTRPASSPATGCQPKRRRSRPARTPAGPRACSPRTRWPLAARSRRSSPWTRASGSRVLCGARAGHRPQHRDPAQVVDRRPSRAARGWDRPAPPITAPLPRPPRLRREHCSAVMPRLAVARVDDVGDDALGRRARTVAPVLAAEIGQPLADRHLPGRPRAGGLRALPRERTRPARWRRRACSRPPAGHEQSPRR